MLGGRAGGGALLYCAGPPVKTEVSLCFRAEVQQPECREAPYFDQVSTAGTKERQFAVLWLGTILAPCCPGRTTTHDRWQCLACSSSKLEDHEEKEEKQPMASCMNEPSSCKAV